MKKVILIAPMLSFPAKGGPYLRTMNGIKALHRLSELHIISRVSSRYLGGEQAQKRLASLCHRFLFCPSVAGVDSAFDNLFDILSSKPLIKSVIKYIQGLLIYEMVMFFMRRYFEVKTSKIDAQYIVEYARKQRCHIIWFTYASISVDLIKQVSRLDPRLKIISDTDSVWSRFIARGIPYESSVLRKAWLRYVSNSKKIEEKEFTTLSDVVTAVSATDATYYKSIATKNVKVLQYSNVIDLSEYKSTKINKEPFLIHFAGSFGVNSPTDQAIRWFIHNVFPKLVRKNPQCRLEVVGKGSTFALSDIQDARISIVGEVESVVPYLLRSQVVIVPLFFESGTRYKILEAGATKNAVVSTTLGAEGIEVTPFKDILISDDPQDFAKQILYILNNPRQQKTLGNNLHQLVVDKYSLTKQRSEAKVILESI